MMRDLIGGLIAGLIILGILIASKVTSGNASALQLSAVIVTNTIYEAMLMFLLAYGLVAFPKLMWHSADLDYSLLLAQMRAASEFKKLSDSSLDVSLVVSDVMKTKKQLDSYGDQILNDSMKVLLADVPEGFTSSTMGKVATDKNGQVTVDTLAELRTRLNVFKDRYRMAQGRVETVKFNAYTLEDICNARTRDDGQQKIFWSLYNRESTEADYRWHLKIIPLLYRVGAVLTALLAIFMLLGVIGSIKGVASNVSVYYTIVHSDSANATGIVIFVLFTLGYTAYITLWSLLQVKVAGLMELVEGSTTPESMSFNVRMCMRLTPPLAFFYLGWLSENGVHNTGNFLLSSNGVYAMPLAFTRIYQIGKVAALRNSFGTVFPILLFCLVFVFMLNLWNRIAVMAKVPNFQFGAELVTDDILREGKRQLQRYKKHMERKCQRKEFKGRIDGAGKKEAPGLLQRIANFFTAAPGTAQDSSLIDEEAGEGTQGAQDVAPKMPAPLSGMLERKGGKKLTGGSSWKQV